MIRLDPISLKKTTIQVRLKTDQPWIDGNITYIDKERQQVFVDTKEGEYQFEFFEYPKLFRFKD